MCNIFQIFEHGRRVLSTCLVRRWSNSMKSWWFSQGQRSEYCWIFVKTVKFFHRKILLLYSTICVLFFIENENIAHRKKLNSISFFFDEITFLSLTGKTSPLRSLQPTSNVNIGLKNKKKWFTLTDFLHY